MNYSLTESDIAAIMAALPLVPLIDIGDEALKITNAAHCVSVGEKLARRDRHITKKEGAVICSAINGAFMLLSGQCPQLFHHVDDELRKEIAPHLFTYNRLIPLFDDLLQIEE